MLAGIECIAGSDAVGPNHEQVSESYAPPSEQTEPDNQAIAECGTHRAKPPLGARFRFSYRRTEHLLSRKFQGIKSTGAP